MKKVFRCMAGRRHTAVFIVMLLILQAFCELALPALTADIIDIGVGQSGITSVLADSISAEGMERLALLMTKEERDVTFAGYARSGDVYFKNKMSPEEEEKLLTVMTPPMVAVYALSTEGADYKEVLGEDLYVPRDLDAFGILRLLPEDTRLELTAAARERIQEIPQSLITQAAINFLREDMKSQEIDIQAVQNQYLLAKGIQMIAAALGMIAAAVLASLLTARFAAACAAELRVAVFGHVLALEEEQAEAFSVADLTSRTMDDVQKIQQFLITFFRSVLTALLLGIGASALGRRSGHGMGRIVFTAFLAGLLCMAAFLAAAAGSSGKVKLWTERLKRTVHEQLRGLMVIRAFGSEEREEKRLETENRRWKQSVLRMNRLVSLLIPVLLLIMNGTILFISGQSAAEINEGYLKSGELIASIQYAVLVVGAFLSLSVYASILPEGLRSISRIDELLCVPVPEKKDSAVQEKGTGEESSPAVCFRDASFRYPHSAAWVLQQLSFSVEAGETAAIVGGTGAGKTTLLRMILAEYKTGQGNILVNGKDVKDYDTKRLSEKISYIPQNAGLFKGSIAENLRFRKENASERELWEALAAAQAEDFVGQMEKGLEAEVAQGGANLSGGQRQRLAAARALVGDAQIYLIDDCFSALDHQTASHLRRSLADKMKGAAVLMAVSQIRMIGDADKIIVLDRGRIVGMGCHDALMKNCAFYRRLAYSQGIREVAEDAR